jgi:ubiquinone/menaquinone biosynthesis C-methylase UbiE
VSDVLVIGSGSGRIVGGLAAAYPFRVVGVDLDEERTAEARSSYGTVERTRFETSDPRRLPFAAASFDLVVTQASYHRPAEWQAALEEAGRVLRPAGHLFWLDLEVEPEQRTLLRLWRHRYGLYTPDEVRAAHGGATASGSHFRRLARPETRREPLVLVKEPRAA